MNNELLKIERNCILHVRPRRIQRCMMRETKTERCNKRRAAFSSWQCVLSALLTFWGSFSTDLDTHLIVASHLMCTAAAVFSAA